MNPQIVELLRQQVIERLEGDDRIMEIIHDTIDCVFAENSIDCSTDDGMDAMVEVASNITLR